ncbi:MAG: hypothetical protein NWS46_11325, partial [Cyclobacteriaceae bacterium]|nr:hypothetical protein [Cyclobacteriaceae bacterium]
YSEFIKGLHKILNTTNFNIKYKKSIGFFAYIAIVIFFLIAVLIFPLASIFLLFRGQMIYGGIGALASILLIFRMLKYSKRINQEPIYQMHCRIPYCLKRTKPC